VFYNLRKKLNRYFFNVQTNLIREKTCVNVDDTSNFLLVTQLCDPDINMYLLAVSSFCQYLTPRSIIVVSDNLSEKNHELLHRCIKGLKIIPIDELQLHRLPKGGTWERLICILKNIEHSYVVQMDADILTLRRPDEIIAAIKDNKSFTITSKLGFDKMSFVNASYLVWERTSLHVQNEAEKAFKRCHNAENRLYVRGCSGLTGFARQSSSIKTLTDFSCEIEQKIGKEKWLEWGSEQVASNYIIANSENSRILPYQYYPFYEPAIDESKVKLFHFIGTHRFKKGRYLVMAKQHINSI